MFYCISLSSQNSNLIADRVISVTPAANQYVSPFTHYINYDITSLIPAGYSLFGVFPQVYNSSAPMTCAMGGGDGHTYLRVWAMSNQTVAFNLLLVKYFKNIT